MRKYEAEVCIYITLMANSEEEANLMLIDRIAPPASVGDVEFNVDNVTCTICEVKYEAKEKNNGF